MFPRPPRLRVGGERRARLTWITPAAKPAAPPRKARLDAIDMTSLKPIFFFSGVAVEPARSPMAGKGAALRSAAVKLPAERLANAGWRADIVKARGALLFWSVMVSAIVSHGVFLGREWGTNDVR